MRQNDQNQLYHCPTILAFLLIDLDRSRLPRCNAAFGNHV
jgi:hypothetical protein